MLLMYCVFATPYQSKEVKKPASYLMIGVTLFLQCWLMPNVYKLRKILQQNSLIYILVEVVKPLWNSHCKVRISLNIGPFVWYNFDFTLHIFLAFFRSTWNNSRYNSINPSYYGRIFDRLFSMRLLVSIYFFTCNHNSSNYFLFSQKESSLSDVPNSENNSLGGGVSADKTFISPSILSVSLYFNLIYFWLLGLW